MELIPYLSMPIKVFFIIIISIILQDAIAQPIRQFDLCDLTEYTLNSDNSIVTGKYELYYKTRSGLQLIHRFDLPAQNYYIRDFDIISPDCWYTLLGNRTIGDLTFLFKSSDRGQNWCIDTTYFKAIDSTITNLNFNPVDPNYYNSINQVQTIGKDTILLFLGYYGSGIVYSVDAGTSWSHWFGNTPAHYFGMFECENDYYLFQLEGDGFQGRMFSFDKKLLFRKDSIVNFNHLPSGSGHHPPFHLNDLPNVVNFSNLSNCEAYTFLENYVNDRCNLATSIQQNFIANKITIYPSPSNGIFTIEIESLKTFPLKIVIYNDLGQVVYRKLIPDYTTQWFVKYF